jgi:hypothetical protein
MSTEPSLVRRLALLNRQLIILMVSACGEALERFELEVVVGGLTDNTPWGKKIALTGSYFEERIVVGVPASTPPPKDIEGLEIAAQRGEPMAAYL